MKVETLETYLGKEVQIKMFDGSITFGILIKGSGYENRYYQCSGQFWFRASHVIKLKEIAE